jgi:hypothetical protein
MDPAASPDVLQPLFGRVVVVDTDSSFVYLGRLVQANREWLVLEEVDVHETGEVGLSKERYVHETRGLGVRANRKRTWLRLARVLSVSPLDDVIAF